MKRDEYDTWRARIGEVRGGEGLEWTLTGISTYEHSSWPLDIRTRSGREGAVNAEQWEAFQLVSPAPQPEQPSIVGERRVHRGTISREEYVLTCTSADAEMVHAVSNVDDTPWVWPVARWQALPLHTETAPAQPRVGERRRVTWDGQTHECSLVRGEETGRGWRSGHVDISGWPGQTVCTVDLWLASPLVEEPASRRDGFAIRPNDTRVDGDGLVWTCTGKRFQFGGSRKGQHTIIACNQRGEVWDMSEAEWFALISAAPPPPGGRIGRCTVVPIERADPNAVRCPRCGGVPEYVGLHSVEHACPRIVAETRITEIHIARGEVGFEAKRWWLRDGKSVPLRALHPTRDGAVAALVEAERAEGLFAEEDA